MSGLPHRHAVTIGINAYSGGLAPLRTAVNDARAVAAALEDGQGYRDPIQRLDAGARRGDVVRLLEDTLPEIVRSESAVVLYFAGHGVAMDGDDGPEGYLMPQDADAAKPETWLRMSDVRHALNRLACRHLLVVLDCCFAGSFRWSATRASKLPALRPLYDSQYARYLKGDAWQVLTSASHQEEARDVLPGAHNFRDPSDGGSSAAGHSPFAAALLAGLSGSADSSRGEHGVDGVITATELYQYVFEKLVPAGEKRVQTPGLWPLKPEGTGHFIFGNPQHERDTRPDPTLDDANNPWLGLEAYGGGDAPLFFGRDRVIEALEARLADDEASPLIAVVGASGTGKSSVVKAGLLPRLRDRPEAWVVVATERLGPEPVQQLAATLKRLGAAPEDRHLLLVIDQFEELYTQCPDAEVRERFLSRLARLLAEQAPRLKVLITLRSDFEARLAASPSLAASFAEGRFLVPAFSSEELRDVIEGPAEAKALYFDPPELTGTLLDEVMAMPGGLPLLSFALAEIYRRAQLRRRESGDLDRALTLADYRTAGRVTGALHRRASELYDAAGRERQAVIRRLFLRMVSLEGGRLARRRVSRRELEYTGEGARTRVDGVLEEFVGARLLVAGDGHVEPAHDTLVTAWERVAGWLSETGTLELQRQAWRAADDWSRQRRADGAERGERAHGLLWDGDPRLPQVAAMRGELNSLERDFVDASVQRRKRRWQGLAAAVTAVIAALAVLTLYSLSQTRLAERRLESAITAVQEIEFTVGAGLRPIAGASRVREELQAKTRQLLTALEAEDDLDLRFQVAANHDSSGELALESGDLKRAAADFHQAAAVLEEVLAAAPADDRRLVNWQSNLTVVYLHLERVAFVTGDLAAARSWAEKSFEISATLAAAPDAPALPRRGSALAATALGEIAAAEGDPAAAREHYQQALATFRGVAELEPTVSQYQRDVAVGYSKLAELAVVAGAWGEARQWYRKELEIYRRLVDAEPENAAWHSDLATTATQLALIARLLGDATGSRELQQESLAIREQLARAEPENVDWQRRLANSYLSEGDRLLAEDPAATGDWYRKALAIAEAVLEKEPANTDSLGFLALCYLNLGSLAETTGDLAAAGAWYEKQLGVAERLVAAEASAAAESELATACHRLGGLALAAGDAVRARDQIGRAVEIYRRLAAAQPDAAPYRNRLVQAYNELGGLAAAEGDRESARQLYQQGLTVAQRLAEKEPGRRGLNVFSVLLGYQLLAGLLAEDEPEEALRYLELYRRLRAEHLDLEMVGDTPEL